MVALGYYVERVVFLPIFGLLFLLYSLQAYSEFGRYKIESRKWTIRWNLHRLGPLSMLMACLRYIDAHQAFGIFTSKNSIDAWLYWNACNLILVAVLLLGRSILLSIYSASRQSFAPCLQKMVVLVIVQLFAETEAVLIYYNYEQMAANSAVQIVILGFTQLCALILMGVALSRFRSSVTQAFARLSPSHSSNDLKVQASAMYVRNTRFVVAGMVLLFFAMVLSFVTGIINLTKTGVAANLDPEHYDTENIITPTIVSLGASLLLCYHWFSFKLVRIESGIGFAIKFYGETGLNPSELSSTPPSQNSDDSSGGGSANNVALVIPKPLRAILQEIPDSVQRVNASEFHIGAVLGEGYSAVVHSVKWHGTDVAAKLLKANQDETSCKEFVHEVHISHVLGNHPRVIQFLGVCLRPMASLLALMANGSLYQLLFEKQEFRFDDATVGVDVQFKNLSIIAKMLIDASAGLLHCHSKCVVHRDIAARNFLVDDHHRVTIADFGMSREFTIQRQWIQVEDEAVPVKWSSPETLLFGVHSSRSDVYSFGIFLFEALCRWEPYPGESPMAVAPGVHRAIMPTRPEILAGIPVDLALLMISCWRPNPKNRPDMPQVNKTLQIFSDSLTKKTWDSIPTTQHSTWVVATGKSVKVYAEPFDDAVEITEIPSARTVSGLHSQGDWILCNWGWVPRQLDGVEFLLPVQAIAPVFVRGRAETKEYEHYCVSKSHPVVGATVSANQQTPTEVQNVDFGHFNPFVPDTNVTVLLAEF